MKLLLISLIVLSLNGCGAQLGKTLNPPNGQVEWEDAGRRHAQRFLVPVVERDTRVKYNQLTGIQQHELALREFDFLRCIHDSKGEAQERRAQRQHERFTISKTPAECKAIRDAPLGNSDGLLFQELAKVEFAEFKERARLQARLQEMMDLDTGSSSRDTVIVSPTIKGITACNSTIGGGVSC